MAISARRPHPVRSLRVTPHSDFCGRRTPPATTLAAVAASLDAEHCLRCRLLKRLLDSLPVRRAGYHYV